MIKRVAALAAMAIFAGTMIGSTEPARAYLYYHDYEFYTFHAYSGGVVKTGGPIWANVAFTSFGGSVKANWITIVNNGRNPISIDTFRWQALDGSPFYRGPGGTVYANDSHANSITWNLDKTSPWVKPISFSEDPVVIVAVHEVGNRDLTGRIDVRAAPPYNQYVPDDPPTYGNATILEAPVSVQASTVPEPSSIWIMLTALVGLIGHRWRGRLFPSRHSA